MAALASMQDMPAELRDEADLQCGAAAQPSQPTSASMPLHHTQVCTTSGSMHLIAPPAWSSCMPKSLVAIAGHSQVYSQIS